MVTPDVANRRPTMADVARLAGLSVPTVSRALRDHPDVNEETRAAVLLAAERVGYRTHTVARALRTGRNNAISIVIPYGLLGWWEPLLHGAGRAAAQLGQRVILNPVELATEAGSPGISNFFAEARDVPVDGFVVVTPDEEEWKPVAEKLGMPVVLIDDTRTHPGYHVWSTDNRLGAKRAVEHLLAKGRRRIAALVPQPPSPSTHMFDERLAGYREALTEAGVTPDDDLVWQSCETFPPRLETSDAVDEALDAGVEFDAIFALTDYVAFSALRSLRRNGVGVPEDVSVVGFDDDAAAVALDPALSTVRQPFAELGSSAVLNLLELIEHRETEPALHQLEPNLVERNSS